MWERGDSICKFACLIDPKLISDYHSVTPSILLPEGSYNGSFTCLINQANFRQTLLKAQMTDRNANAKKKEYKQNYKTNNILC